jgi:hypothetical protein
LRQACGGDDVLRSEIESLLSSFDGATTFLEDSPAADLLSAQSHTMPAPRPHRKTTGDREDEDGCRQRLRMPTDELLTAVENRRFPGSNGQARQVPLDILRKLSSGANETGVEKESIAYSARLC